MYNLDIKQQTISIEGQRYTAEDFRSNTFPDFALVSDYHRELYHFLKDWFSDSSSVEVHTSGSTGTPKLMTVQKLRMMQSAQQTCSFLKLKQGDSALLCMPLQYIAGKMFVVRALVAALDLYPIVPSGHPLKTIDRTIQFAAMIPMQVFNSLQIASEKLKLQQIENLIIGGGAIDTDLGDELRNFPNKVYSTYGMTETLSHIALRALNGQNISDRYIPFSSVGLSLSADETLVIDAPLVAEERLYTNDIAKLYDDGSFEIVGRKDNVIISGGVKIQIEKLEALLLPLLTCCFAISSLPDPKFGEIVVLVAEADVDETLISNTLPSYCIPKKIIYLQKIPKTETGKIARHELKKLIE